MCVYVIYDDGTCWQKSPQFVFSIYILMHREIQKEAWKNFFFTRVSQPRRNWTGVAFERIMNLILWYESSFLGEGMPGYSVILRTYGFRIGNLLGLPWASGLFIWMPYSKLTRHLQRLFEWWWISKSYLPFRSVSIFLKGQVAPLRGSAETSFLTISDMKTETWGSSLLLFICTNRRQIVLGLWISHWILPWILKI